MWLDFTRRALNHVSTVVYSSLNDNLVPRVFVPGVGKRELSEQPFWNNKGNNLILPIQFHAVCIYGACLKWLLTEFSILAAGQKDRGLWGREWLIAISFPGSSFPLTSGRKTRALGATISGMRHGCRQRSETRWAEFGYFLCYLKMASLRALVFWPLVKGNEDSGKEIGLNDDSKLCIFTSATISVRHRCRLCETG